MTTRNNPEGAVQTKWIKIVLFAALSVILTVIFYRTVSYSLELSNAIRIFAWIMHFAVLLLSFLLAYLYIKKQFSLERCFLFIAIPLGIIYMLTITPLSPPDETHHYQSSFQLSNYLLFRADKAELGESQYFDYNRFSIHNNSVMSYERLLSEIGQPAPEGNW